MEKTRRSVTLPKEVWELLKIQSQARDLPTSWLIADAVRRVYSEGGK